MEVAEGDTEQGSGGTVKERRGAQAGQEGGPEKPWVCGSENRQETVFMRQNRGPDQFDQGEPGRSHEFPARK